jgi:hypothetical protein
VWPERGWSRRRSKTEECGPVVRRSGCEPVSIRPADGCFLGRNVYFVRCTTSGVDHHKHDGYEQSESVKMASLCVMGGKIWPGPAMKLVGPLAARSPGLGLALALEIERHGSADEILQGHLIDLVAFVDVDGAPDIPLKAGVE